MSNLIERWFNDSINLGVFTTDKNLVITRWNRWLEINTNKANHEVLGRSLFDLYPEIKNGHIGSYYREALDGKTYVISQKLHGYIIPLPLKPRNTGFSHMQQSGIISSLIENDEVVGTITIIEDVTCRVASERLLSESEEMYRTIFEATGTAMLIVEEDTTISYANENALRLAGYSRDEFVGKKRWTEFVADREDLERMTKYHYLRRQNPDEAPKTYEFRLKNRDGRIYHVLLNASIIPGTKRSVISLQDITALKEIQKRLTQSEERYRSIFENAVEGIFQTTPDGKIISINPSFAGIFGYASVEEMITSVSDLSMDIYVNSEDRERFKALIEEKGELKAFEVEVRKKDGSHIWVSYNVRAVRDEKGNIMFYEGTVEDITARKKSDMDLKDSFDRLRKTIGSIIDVISMAVEVRDPYTAGHQKKVANLARSIAKQMGLPPMQVEYVRMAGAIHDLGKISVPAEILSMPRRLTEMEFELVKQHPEIGYNILKNIDDLKNVAMIIMQHHERLDGSGYPNGLKGDEILLEARILAVADVVEAIASHRPYRPAFGIEYALEEIEKNAGILYDKDVVRTCLDLFRNKGFRLE